MPWWPQNPDEYFLGVKKRRPILQPQAIPQRRLPAKPIVKRQVIVRRAIIPRVRQPRVFDVLGNIKRAVGQGMGKTEKIIQTGATKGEQKIKQQIAEYAEKKRKFNAPPTREEIRELKLRGK
jgi:hypothetical protein